MREEGYFSFYNVVLDEDEAISHIPTLGLRISPSSDALQIMQLNHILFSFYALALWFFIF